MTTLVINFEAEGRHFWPNAPKEYSDFGEYHRHVFKFIVWYDIDKSSGSERRDKELFELRREAIIALSEGFPIDNGVLDFEGMSCEGLADYLKEKMNFSRVFCGEDWLLGAEV